MSHTVWPCLAMLGQRRYHLQRFLAPPGLIGFVIIVAWQVVAINLYSLDDWSKATFFVRDGSYTFLASMIYACFGLFVILLRILPRRLVMPRRLAWHVLVRYTLTRGCPEWYRPFASQTIAKWIDNSVTVFYITWASRFVCRALPWILEATSFLLPFSPGRLWSASNAQTRTLVYDTLVAFSRKLMWACLLALSALLLLNLKDPNLSAAQIPMEEQEAVKGASLFPWRPLVWLLAMRARPRLRTSNMRLLLADKCLTCAIYICLISVPLRLINVQLRTVLAVGGVGGLAVGLALQNLVQNLISGILIYTNATICEGLEVELQDVKLQGVVSEVGWFNTTVNGYEGTRVTVPNRRILDGTVIDKTNKRFRVCQKHLTVTFQDPSNLEVLVNTVQDDLRNNPNVLQKSAVLRILMANRGHMKIYEPQFVLAGWSEYGADFYLRAYFEKSLQGDRFLTLQSQLLIAVSKRIKQFGGRLGSPLTPLVPAPVSRDGAEPPQRTPKKWRLMWGSAQAETVQAKILAKRRAMAYLSKQPVCRLEPSLLQQHNAVEAGGGLHASHASPDGVEVGVGPTVETKGYTQRAADAPPPELPSVTFGQLTADSFL
ncbi:unnamed protein product [Durusdinium trenchii]|uniref:Uncharacterized protein n=1 Tax=Durusdinium trenchii TaxID=1381693 RepID=A0ABP0N2Z1_9DINO